MVAQSSYYLYNIHAVSVLIVKCTYVYSHTVRIYMYIHAHTYVLSLCDNGDISIIAIRNSFTITINLTYDLDKCVHCAQSGVNHKNVPAQQISKVTSNT